jgi:two-component system sensor histidine kinase BaeS
MCPIALNWQTIWRYAPRWLRASVQWKLFLSYLPVVLVGLLIVSSAVSSIAPAFFQRSMDQMMGSGMGSGMGGMLTASELDAAFRQALMPTLALATALALLTALIVSYVVARQIAHPVHAMVQATRRIAAGHYAERVQAAPANEGDEFGQLAASFNSMAGALERAERHRLELVGDVAHELRTPLATLEGYLEGLLDGVVEPNERTWAKLHDEAGRLRRLVDDLQELSRAEARQIQLLLQPVAPATIATIAVERLAPQFAEKGVALETTVRDSLPLVRADQDRAVQVLTNLLSNALRYTPAAGHVTLTVDRVGERIAFRVRDTGVGIAPEHLPLLFERFYRVDKSRTRALGGSGIGLTIAKALTEAMGGQISAESRGLGQGSVFTFTLPLAS